MIDREEEVQHVMIITMALPEEVQCTKKIGTTLHHDDLQYMKTMDMTELLEEAQQ